MWPFNGWAHAEARVSVFIGDSKVKSFNGILWINDLIRSVRRERRSIKKSPQRIKTLISVKLLYVTYLLVTRCLLWYTCFQLYHWRASRILKMSSVRPCMCNISALSVLSSVRGRKRKIGSRLSDDLPLQRRYLSSVLRLLSLMGPK